MKTTPTPIHRRLVQRLTSLARALPASTHLAETQAEIEFTRSAAGPFADYLEDPHSAFMALCLAPAR